MAVLYNIMIKIRGRPAKEECHVLRYSDAVTRPGSSTWSRDSIFYGATPRLTRSEWHPQVVADSVVDLGHVRGTVHKLVSIVSGVVYAATRISVDDLFVVAHVVERKDF